ncbi:MAG: ATP-binding protein, partial [Gemmatimonadetes bacterium]|nr:ATP-binding protein [Gemmatimonadota bacterium]
RRTCTCSPAAIHRYRARISGPLLDRIDMHIEVPALAYNDLANKDGGENSAQIAQRVHATRQRQLDRFQGEPFCNAHMASRHLRNHCLLDAPGQSLLEKAMDRLGLSARAYDRILKVARTIADLAESADIRSSHLAEAIQYRSLDRDGGI